MRSRLLSLPFLLMAVCGCPGQSGEGAGRLLLEQTAPEAARLVDAAALARYCARDSMITIVAVTDSWSAAIALRTPWPPVRRFTIDTAPGRVGSAAIAARPLSDSVGVALTAHSGTVELDSGAGLSGRFTALAGRDSLARRFTGRFQAGSFAVDGCGLQ